jgi:hypothetical protein
MRLVNGVHANLLANKILEFKSSLADDKYTERELIQYMVQTVAFCVTS